MRPVSLLCFSMWVGCSVDESTTARSASPPPASCVPGVAAVLDGAPHSAVQDALDAAIPGGPVVVEVCPGTWMENLELPFEGEWTLMGVGGQATLDGGMNGPVLVVPEDTHLSLTDLVLQNGLFDEMGGAVGIFGGSLRAERVDFVDNEAGEGGAVSAYSADLELVDVRFVGNRAVWGESGGGGLNVWQISDGHSVTLRRVQWLNNEVLFDGNGGGLQLVAFADTALTMERVLFEGNSATQGAAMLLQADGGYIHGRLADAVVRNHVGHADSLGTLNLFASPGSQVDLDIVDSVLSDNTAGDGPALWMLGLPDGAPGTTRARLLRSKVLRNTALGAPPPGGPAGAISVYGHALLLLRNANLGLGAADNPTGDLRACPNAYGGGVNGWVAEEVGRFCP